MVFVDSVESYIKEISNLEISENLYFRGQSNDSYELVPGIYRKEGDNYTHLKNEHLMYREIISKSPTEFVNKNTLESLTLMQHYGLPTRVLDVTANALVALYFACNNNFENKGKVFIFNVEEKNVVNYHSDKACVLANLAKLNSEFYYSYKIYQVINNTIDDIIKNLEHWHYELISINGDYEYIRHFINKKNLILLDQPLTYYLNNNLFERIIYPIQQEIEEKYDVDAEEQNIQVYLKNKFFTELYEILISLQKEKREEINKNQFNLLLDFIKEDRTYFEPRIEPADINNILLVKPKLDNARIVRQQGAFFLFGIKSDGSDKQIPIFNNNWITEEILIDHNAKENILKDLEMLGINEISLFPEIDYVAKYIKKNYRVY